MKACQTTPRLRIRLLLSLITLLLAGGGLSTASGQEEAESRFGGLRAELLKRFDKDGDGRLSASERAEMRAAAERRRAGETAETPLAGAGKIIPGRTPLYKIETGPLKTQSVPTVTLKRPEGERPLLCRVTYPQADGKYPLIVLCHGMGGSKDGLRPLAEHWASHGYIVIQPTHGDSLKNLKLADILKYRSAKDFVNDPQQTKYWNQRPEDVSSILDQLDAVIEQVPAVADTLNRELIGVGGHSFGAHTTMMVAGMKLFDPKSNRSVQLLDERPKAFVAISPQGRSPSAKEVSWAGIERPILYITGSNDKSPANGKSPQWRIDAFRFTPPAKAYLLWVEGAYHNFGGISGPIRYPSAGPMNRDHILCVQSASLAMWDAYLKQDAEALVFLRRGNMQSMSNGAARLFRGGDDISEIAPAAGE
jgi:dienelactone hydrolase